MTTDRPLCIYLDQNKWIELARTYYDYDQNSDIKPLVENILNGVETNTVIFPLSAESVIETQKIRNVERRKRLVDFMVRVSRGNTIAAESYMIKWELEHALAESFGQKIIQIPSVLGFGIQFAFGWTGKVYGKNNNLVEIPNELQEKMNSYLVDTNLITDILMGDKLDIEEAIKHLEEQKKAHVEMAENFRRKVREFDKKLLKRAYLANRMVALYDYIDHAMKKYEKTIKDFLLLGPDGLEDFFNNIPTLNTEAELVTRRNEHWDKKIDPNDLIDIGFLSVAIPYCDIVVTEVYWANIVKQTALGKEYNTQVISSLTQLLPQLPQ